MEINIRTLDGQSTQVQVEPSQTIGDLKKILQLNRWDPLVVASTSKSSGSSAGPFHFHLFLKGSKLNAGTLVSSLSLKQGEFLVLMPYTKKNKWKASWLEMPDPHDGSALKLSDCSERHGNIVNKCNASSFASVCSKKQGDCSEKVAEVYDMLNCPEMVRSVPLPVADQSGGAAEEVWNAIVADLAAWKSTSCLLDEGISHVDITSGICDGYGKHEASDGANDSGSVHSLDYSVRHIARTRSQFGSNKKQRNESFRFKHATRRHSRKDTAENEITPTESYADADNTLGDVKTLANSDISADILCDSVNTEADSDGNSSYVVKCGESKRCSWFRKIPLCPVLEKFDCLFVALNVVYGFLQKHHVQGTWQNMRTMLQQLCGFQIDADDVEKLALLFPELVKISCRVGEGEAASFNVDLLELSGHCHHEATTTLYGVMPFKSNKGGKQTSATAIGNTIKKCQIFFQKAVDNLIKELQISQTCSKVQLTEMTLDDILAFKLFPKTIVEDNLKQVSTFALPGPARQRKKLMRCMDTKDLIVAEMIDHLKKGLGSLGQIVHCETIKPRVAQYGHIGVPLSRLTEIAIRRLGISKFYVHQAEAINAVVSGKSVVVATSTASGKSICYNVPVLEELYSNPESCALYLFPTKALAQDQLRALLEMTNGLHPTISMGAYDGDAPQHQRLKLRDHGRILITNPDMLHVSILPSHKQFERFLSNLRYVVIDEAHAYRGAFGCHTAVILRRLCRLCHHLYGLEPIFIVTSATMANPQEHAMELIGLRTIHLIEEDGSPCGEKLFMLWNPPVYSTSLQTSNMQNSQDSDRANNLNVVEMQPVQIKRSSPIMEATSLLAEMVQHNLRCICFCKSRKLSELVLSYTRGILRETAPNHVNTVQAYRAGYTAQDRRNIEIDLFGGRLHAVAATNALELGVDVGNLDATLHLGFPGTIASLWQQAGRSGRREKPSLSIYIAFESPLDQHFMKNPHKLFSRSIEHAQIDACNPKVLGQHLACAALEYPLHIQHDEEFFGSGVQASISELANKGQLGRHPNSSSQDDSWHYTGLEKVPSQVFNIRAIDAAKYTIINHATNEVIEEVEESKAFFQVYEGAVYIHQGKTYLVKTLDLGAKVALCQQADLKYYTKTRDFTDVHVMGGELAYPRKVFDLKCPTTTAQASMCKVTTRWIGFRRIWHGTNEAFDSVDLFLPDYSYDSEAVWIRVPRHIRKELDTNGLPLRAGLHAASHVLLNIMPLYIMCNTSDLGTECANPHDTRYFPDRLLIFDRNPGGIGIAVQARPLFAELLQAALELLVSCECTTDVGCPNCVQYLECSEYNEVIHKQAAILILQGVIQAEDSYRQSKSDAQK